MNPEQPAVVDLARMLDHSLHVRGEAWGVVTAGGMAFGKASTGDGFVQQASGESNHRGAAVRHLRLMRALVVGRREVTDTPNLPEEAICRGFPGPGRAGPASGRGTEPVISSGY